MSEADNAPMNRIPSPGHPTATNSSANRKAQKPTNKWLALVVTALGTLLAGLTASSINVALPVMAADEFGVGQSDIQWVVTVFLIVISSTMLLLGSIGDRIGSHKIYNSGLIVFTLGSLFCGLVGSLSASMGLSSGLGLGLLLVGRVIQGIGAAMTMATGMALVTTIFPPEQRGMALGFSVLVVGLGNVGGPAIGGMVLAFSTWPMIFYLNIPLAMVALVLGLAKLRSPMPPQKNAPRLDIMGAFILLITLAALITGIDGQFPYARWFLAPAIILIPVLILAERRHPSPLLNFQLLGNRRFSFGNLVTFFSYSSNMLLV
ncbi:MAG: MFS transporter, partial [Coriobacteriales bacterium]|nr:MFS transporter [Coriobacteriales bacterium]